jgi:hypothetical protein
MRNVHLITKHIYITSDEEIKGGDYVTNGKYIGQAINEWWTKFYIGNPKLNYWKIILSTDIDLIKDGIQPINDEFLEWFIKNPSCDKIKIELQHQYHTSKEFYHDAGYINCTKEQYESIKKEIPTCPLKIVYKIIIPQESTFIHN